MRTSRGRSRADRAALHELFGDAVIVNDQRRRDSTLLPVLVVIDLDDVDPATVRQRDRLSVPNRVPVIDDDPYLSTCHVYEAKPWHDTTILTQKLLRAPRRARKLRARAQFVLATPRKEGER
jgi:hypothetical protein